MKLYYAELPECYGYGCVAVGKTEKEARNALKSPFQKLRESYGDTRTFQQAWIYFGGHIVTMEVGIGYRKGLDL